MHSPNMNGPSVAMRRPEYYGCIEQGSQQREPSSKILQSLLYNFAQNGYLNSPPGESRSYRGETSPRSTTEGESPTESTSHMPQEYSRARRYCPDMSPPARQQNGYRHLHQPHNSSQVGLEPNQFHPRCFQNPSATIPAPVRGREAAAYTENYLSPRHRSSSIGSAGSSFRDSRSPSHDSTTSHDSLSRCSPLSISSSPSPSPPTPDNTPNSKLLGILKGASYNYPYATVTNNRNSQPQDTANSNSVTSHRRSSSNSDHSSTSHYTNSHRHLYDPTRTQKATPHSSFETRKRVVPQCQDEPIDLSLKPKKKRTDSSVSDSSQPLERRLSWRSDYYYSCSSADGEEPAEPDSTPPRKSILESILCGRSSSTKKKKVPTATLR